MSNKTQKKPVVRKDVKVKRTIADITKEPVNNNEVGKMNQRYLYEKTGNWVVYGRMLQLKRKEGYYLDDNVIKIKTEKK